MYLGGSAIATSDDVNAGSQVGSTRRGTWRASGWMPERRGLGCHHRCHQWPRLRSKYIGVNSYEISLLYFIEHQDTSRLFIDCQCPRFWGGGKEGKQVTSLAV